MGQSRNSSRRAHGYVFHLIAIVAFTQLQACVFANSDQSSESFFFTAVFPGKASAALVQGPGAEAAFRESFLRSWEEAAGKLGLDVTESTDVLAVRSWGWGVRILIRLQCEAWTDAKLLEAVVKQNASLLTRSFEGSLANIRFDDLQIGDDPTSMYHSLASKL